MLLWQLHAVKPHSQLTSEILQVLVTRYDQLDSNVVSLYPFQFTNLLLLHSSAVAPAADSGSGLCCIVISHFNHIRLYLVAHEDLRHYIDAGQASCAVMG